MRSSTAAVAPAGCGPRCWERTTGSCPRPALSSGSPQLPHHGTRCCWLARPLQAAVVSALSFTVGAALPLTLIVLAPIGVRVRVTALAALALLALLGAIGARIGRVASQLGQAAAGLRLAERLVRAGLELIEFRGRYVIRELSPGLRSPAWAAREAMVAAGMATAEDLRRWDQAFEATAQRPPTFFAPMFTAIGRRPA